MSELDEFQAEVGAWVSRCFPAEDPLERALVLCEEAGEVARAALKRHQNIRGTKAEWTVELLKELGDVIICVAATAYVEGVPLSEIVSKRWADISARDYATDPQQHGVTSGVTLTPSAPSSRNAATTASRHATRSAWRTPRTPLLR